ncbi:hypothetical protein C8A05DRAFT_36090, partial [Staphylotrichum tortipilum]
MATSHGVLQTPRVVLVITFPLASLILYLVLSLGCITDSLSGISPVIARSDGPVNLGGQIVQVDLRVGFFGLCFGPAPVNCTGSSPILNPKPQSQLASEIPLDKGGGNFALASLAQGLQSSLVVLSGIPLLLLLIASLIANLVQLYFNSLNRTTSTPTLNTYSNGGSGGNNPLRRERNAQAALFARALDWAAAAGAATSFAAYQAVVSAATRLLRTTAAGVPLNVSAGGTASSVFAAVVGLTAAGAVVNTVLAAMDAGVEGYFGGV